MRSRASRLMRTGVFIVCTALLPGIGFGQFTHDPIRALVTVSETRVPAGSSFDVMVDFELDAGVHMYKDRISFKWEKLEGVQHVGDAFPTGRMIRDEWGFSADESGMIEVYDGSVRVAVRMRSTGEEGDRITILGKLTFSGCSDEICYPPETVPIELNLITAAALTGQEAGVREGPEGPEPAQVLSKEKVGKAAAGKKRGAIWLIVISFGAGIGLSLTPCVYPMIPITAAIVGGTKQKGRLGGLLSSMVYVLGISITYSVLGLLVASGGATVRTALASPWVLVPIAVVFVLLALSMFDVISIQVQPKALSRLQSSLSGKGHVLAIFALGIVSGLVVGPCLTAPLAAILVDIARRGDMLLGFLRLFTLAWGMGVILIVAGTFTSALPRAGEWTLWVKRLFGFAMLWAAAYFVRSVIGQSAYHMAAAAVLLAGAVFLGGFDTLMKESGFADRAKRLVGLIAVFAAGYLLIGVLLRSDRATRVEASREGGHEEAETAPPGTMEVFREGDYQEVQKAIASGRPVVLDFYGKQCPNCKRLDDKTFSDPRVVNALAGFHAFKVNVDVDVYEEPSLTKKFKVFGSPTVILIGSDGREIEELRFVGFKAAEEFLEILNKVK